jgi:hypothetical protein
MLCNSLLVRVIKSLRGTGGVVDVRRTGLVRGGEPVMASAQAGKPGMGSYTLPHPEHEILPQRFLSLTIITGYLTGSGRFERSQCGNSQIWNFLSANNIRCCAAKERCYGRTWIRQPRTGSRRNAGYG